MTPSMKQQQQLPLLRTQVLRRVSELADPQGLLFGAVALWVGLETNRYLGRGCTVCGSLAHTCAIMAIVRLVRRGFELLDDDEDQPEEGGECPEMAKNDEQSCSGSCPRAVIPEQQETCCICLDELDHRSCCRGQLRRLDCGHEFHRRCVNEWLKTRPVCPLCKDGEQKASANNNGRRRTSERQRQNNRDGPRSDSHQSRAQSALPSRESQIRLTVAALYMMVHHPIKADNDSSEEKPAGAAEVPQEENNLRVAAAPADGAGTARPWAMTFNSRSSARLPLLSIPNENGAPLLIQAA